MNDDTASIVFYALSDPIRRDILRRLKRSRSTVNEIAVDYHMSLAAVSKHLKILHETGLIHKRRHGKYVIVQLNPPGLQAVSDFCEEFELIANRK